MKPLTTLFWDVMLNGPFHLEFCTPSHQTVMEHFIAVLNAVPMLRLNLPLASTSLYFLCSSDFCGWLRWPALIRSCYLYLLWFDICFSLSQRQMAHTAELTHRQIYSHCFVFQRTSAEPQRSVCVKNQTQNSSQTNLTQCTTLTETFPKSQQVCLSTREQAAVLMLSYCQNIVVIM